MAGIADANDGEGQQSPASEIILLPRKIYDRTVRCQRESSTIKRDCRHYKVSPCRKSAENSQIRSFRLGNGPPQED